MARRGALQLSEQAGQTVSSYMECTNLLKDKIYSSPSNFFKIARTIFGVISFKDFATPSLMMDSIYRMTGLVG